MKKKLITISYSNIDKTDGPVIHYMELWNSFVRQFADRYEVIGVACITDRDAEFLIPASFPMDTISSNYPRPLRLLLQDLYFAFKVFKGRHHIVYLRTGNNMFFSVIAAAIFKVFLITEYNGIAIMDAGSNKKGRLFTAFVSFVERKAIRISTGCIAVSKGIEKHLIDAGARATICIRNGVSDDFFQVQTKRHCGDPRRLVYVGTFTPWDGAENIVNLAKKFPAVEFYFIGDGRCRKDVEEQAKGIKNVFFRNFVDYKLLKTEYANYDAGIILYEVQRNLMELSSLKTLEYLATGLPVFSTRVPGQEFIESEGIGILTDENEIDLKFGQFLEALEPLKENVDIYRKKDGRKYSWDRAARETLEFIDSLKR